MLNCQGGIIDIHDTLWHHMASHLGIERGQELPELDATLLRWEKPRTK